MRKPNSDEFIVCPASRSSTKKQPKAVFDSISPEGKKVAFGIIGDHKHGYVSKKCDWVNLAVPVFHY